MADSAATPSAYKLSHSSPLDTLVRKTSQRNKPTGHGNAQPEPVSAMAPSHSNDVFNTYDGNIYQPRMPILHAHFSRDSTATASTGTGIWYGENQSYVDDSSVYSQAYGDGSALRESWATGTGTGYDTILDDYTQGSESVPSVVISPIDNEKLPPNRPTTGRTPSAAPHAANFSKPLHSLTPESESSKRRVLERNARSPSSPLAQAHSPQSQSSLVRQPVNEYFERPRPAPSPTPSLSPTPPAFLSPNPTVSLPHKPPSLRPSSPTSVYSNYSYYNYESQPSTPTIPTNAPSPLSSRTHLSPTPTPSNHRRTPEDFLSLGITSHEANDLAASATYFQQAATEGGGCGVGMLMWGLTLRHGWGVPPDPKAAFKWLRKAAESAVVDLEGARKGGKGAADDGVKSELVLAIYEVAQCFFHGWGVTKDQKMAVSYYRVAARLGDADAQTDLGFCLANGRGCKKDRKEAAKWYRAAVQQGASDVGLAWIHKEKFQ